ncbi:hypothetical protein BBJ28_00017644 [Nothophytophthora sp. Chile5]|nr:hypothetical protein BBJ28_00017644 [Nothophytophthora sp. Chile5]
MTRRSAAPFGCASLLLLLIPVALGQGDFAALDPDMAAENDAPAVTEDPQFDPYDDKPRGVGADAKYAPKARNVEAFDFDPSEGLTFFVKGESRECFFQDAKFEGDELSGAYVVSSADSHIDLEITNPQGVAVYRRFGDAEGQYQVSPKYEHVSVLAKYASHLDVRLGELESEQRLQLIRTDRHIKGT